MIEKYVTRLQYDSYEDFRDNCKILVPDNFNFGFDIVDQWAKEEPNKIAMVWCDENGAEAKFTFKEVMEYSNKAANLFVSLGIKKGDPVLLLLKRRYEFWFCILALHKIGAIAIPGTHLLSTKDLVYRINAASIKMICTVNDENLLTHIDEAHSDAPSLKRKVLVGGTRSGWEDFNSAIAKMSPEFARPTGDAAS